MGVEEKVSKKGKVYLVGDELQLSFRFSKRMFSSIKNMRGALYDKELKRWKLPLSGLPSLQASKLFSEKDMEYCFNLEEAYKRLEKNQDEVERYNRLVDANPFQVSEELIERADIGCVIRLEAGHLLARVVRRSRKAKSLLEHFQGAYYLKDAKAYHIPAHLINKFLCDARDAKLRFAVAEKTGQALAVGAALRREILSGNHLANSADLSATLLTPYLTVDNKRSICSLIGTTPEQLMFLFAGVRGNTARATKAANLNASDLCMLLSRLECCPYKVWFSSELLECLDENIEWFSDNFEKEEGAIPVLDLFTGHYKEAIWLCDEKEAGLLVFNEALADRVQKLPLKLVMTTHAQFPNLPFFKPKGDFVEFYEMLSNEIPQTAAFKRYLENQREHKKLRERCLAYQVMKDVNLGLQDSELEKKLFPHQRVAVSWLLDTEQAFLGDDMGLGKTLSVLTTFGELHSRGECNFLLVVAPNSLVLNWKREARSWLPNLNLCILPDKGREAMLRELRDNSFYDGLLINYEKVRIDKIYPAIAEICHNKKVMLCLDESQRVKNPQGKSFQALKSFALLCKRRVLLSGTPTPRDLSDIWSQVYLLDEGKRFGKNYYTWLTSVAEIGNQWSDYAVRRFLPDGIKDTVAKVQELLLRRKKSDVTDLPEKLFVTRDIELSGDQAKRYDEVRKELLVEVSSIDGNTTVKQIESLLEEYLRAVQIASNPRIVDEAWQGEPAKFLELDQILDEVIDGQGGKVVIWTNFRHNVEELVKRYSHYGARPFMGGIKPQERDRTVMDFQDPKSPIKVIVAIPAAGGVGITLTAAQTAVYLDKTWNGEHWQQSIDRIHRIGQTGTVTIISLSGCPVDELIASNLAKKMKAQAKLLGDGQSEAALLPTKDELLAALKK